MFWKQHMLLPSLVLHLHLPDILRLYTTERNISWAIWRTEPNLKVWEESFLDLWNPVDHLHTLLTRFQPSPDWSDPSTCGPVRRKHCWRSGSMSQPPSHPSSLLQQDSFINNKDQWLSVSKNCAQNFVFSHWILTTALGVPRPSTSGQKKPSSFCRSVCDF